jgi:hypothetical protein
MENIRVLIACDSDVMNEQVSIISSVPAQCKAGVRCMPKCNVSLTTSPEQKREEKKCKCCYYTGNCCLLFCGE